MKVSNRAEIQKIYQDQIKKSQDTKSGDAFKKIMQSSQKSESTAKVFHPPSGVNLTNPIFNGTPVKQADPVDTMKFAAEVVANESDIREEKVARLKQLIDAGQYNISPEDVAEKILASGIITKSWEA